MWPLGWTEFAAWLGLARNLAASSVLGRLSIYPILRSYDTNFVARALRRASAFARRRWRSRGRWPDYVTDRMQFVRWFCELAFRESLRLVLAPVGVSTCLAEISGDQRRLLLWLYVDQLTFAQVSAVLRSDAVAVRLQSHEAYDALRSRIVPRLGENNDAFPLFPAR